MMRLIKKHASGAFVAVAFYLLIAMTAYRFAHSEQTETELLFNILDAITWKWLW